MLFSPERDRAAARVRQFKNKIAERREGVRKQLSVFSPERDKIAEHFAGFKAQICYFDNFSLQLLSFLLL